MPQPLRGFAMTGPERSANDERENGMTKAIHAGGVTIGGGAPVSVQSMCNTKTEDVEATVGQVKALAAAGCDLVRLAVPSKEAAAALRSIREQSPVPLVADIHFDYRLAVAAAEAGMDKIRINPGNIGPEENVHKVADACRAAGIEVSRSLYRSWTRTCPRLLRKKTICRYTDLFRLRNRSRLKTSIKRASRTVVAKNRTIITCALVSPTS